MSFKTRPLSDALGVEVMGVDPSRDIDEAGIAELRRLWLKHCILLFRGVDWTPARQVAFTRRFGALHIMPGLASEHSTNHPDHPEVMVVSNIKRAGKPIGLKRAGWGWHSDGEDKMLPNMGSLLHALKLPPDTGDTAFANSYKAYDSLPKATRDLIAGRLVRPVQLSLPVTYAYWVVCPKATAKLPKITTFRDWLLAEAAEDARRLKAL